MEQHQEKLLNRRDRRTYLKRQGILKAKSQMKYKDWLEFVQHNISEGNTIHRNNKDIWERNIREQMSSKESNIMKSLKERGLKDKEINEYIKRWYAKNSIN